MDKVFKAEKIEDMESYLIDGILMFKDLNPEFHLRKIQQMLFPEDDIFVCGFPKSGNVWLVTTLYAILSAENLDKFVEQGTDSPRRAIEDVHVWEEYSKASHPVVYLTHMMYDLLPEVVKQRKNKVVHIRRNPKDVSVSMFHYTKMWKFLDETCTINRTWDEFFNNVFLNESVPMFGNYFEYHREWMKYRKEPNILFITYEEFLADPKVMVAKLASFLEKPLTPDQLQRITQIISFDGMQKNDKLNVVQPELLDENRGRFIRKGSIGDWRNLYTVRQSEIINKKSEEFTSETGVAIEFI